MTTAKLEDDAERIAALGNAIVPQCAEVATRWLVRLMGYSAALRADSSTMAAPPLLNAPAAVDEIAVPVAGSSTSKATT